MNVGREQETILKDETLTVLFLEAASFYEKVPPEIKKNLVAIQLNKGEYAYLVKNEVCKRLDLKEITKEIESKHLVNLLHAVDSTSDLFQHLLNKAFDRKEEIFELSKTDKDLCDKQTTSIEKSFGTELENKYLDIYTRIILEEKSQSKIAQIISKLIQNDEWKKWERNDIIQV